MSAHRYWRLIGLSAQGNDSNLALTEVKLLSNSLSVSGSITPTSNFSPMSGSLAALVDGDLSTGVVFYKSILQRLALTWDLGSDKSVTDIQFGSSLLQTEFLLSSTLQFSNDGVTWFTYTVYTAPSWPGSNSLTTSDYLNSYWDAETRNSNPAIATDRTYVSPVYARSIKGSLYRQSGVCQFEIKLTTLSPGEQSASNTYLAIGVTSDKSSVNSIQNDNEAYAIYTSQSAIFGGVSTPSYVINNANNSLPDGTVVGVVVNFDTGSLEFFIDGVSKGIATATAMLGKVIVPIVSDTSGYLLRNLRATLKINSFDYPVAGAEPWSPSPRVTTDRNIFRVYGADSSSILFAGAQSPPGNLVLRQIFSEVQGNYIDPGKGVITGYAKIPDPKAAVENSALANLLFASHFSGVNGSNVFIDEKGHNIVTYGDCKIEVDGPSAINPARRSVFYTPGGVGNGIRVPISSLADSLNLSTGDFTIRTWFYLKEDAIAGRYSVFDWGGGYNYSWPNIRLQFSSNTTLNIALRSSSRADGDSPDIAYFVDVPESFPGKGQWVHLALTRENSLFRLWVAGKKKYEVASSLGLHNSFNLSGINIGSAGYDIRYAPSPSDGASAYFDDFQIFNTCLYKSDFTPDVTKEFSLSPIGIPVSRKIDLFRESDGMLVRQMWSDPITGIYRFDGLNPNYNYSVVGYDHTNQFKATIVNGRKVLIAP